VENGDEAATSASDADETRGDDHGPAEVKRRHRRVLIRDRIVGVSAVDVGSVLAERVDKAVLRQHARRCKRICHVDRKSNGRDRDHPRADHPIVPGMSSQHPDYEDRGEGEMNEDVIAIQETNHRVAVHCQTLQSALGEDMQVALHPDHTTGVGHGLGRVVAREVTNLAIPEEDRHDQGEFAERA
jgi:hypothetical protein